MEPNQRDILSIESEKKNITKVIQIITKTPNIICEQSVNEYQFHIFSSKSIFW